MHVIRQLIQKYSQFSKELHILFTDYVKSFSNMKTHMLWNILYQKGIQQHLIGQESSEGEMKLMRLIRVQQVACIDEFAFG